MAKKQKMIPLKELNLTDRFLSDEVMEDPAAHQDALSIIFGREIPLLEFNSTEKELRFVPAAHSIRMDVFSIDKESVVYNTEMQQQKRADLSKRSRYYQSMTDVSLLEPGVPDYNLLNKTYTIMITPFDLFGYDRYVYTFTARCHEEPDCMLDDGATRIFLNTRGKNDEEVSKELVDFLHYLENSTDAAVKGIESKRIKRIHDRVCKVKASEEVGVKYMQAWEEKYYEKEEARKEGLQEGARNKLKEIIRRKARKGKSAEEIAGILEEDLSTVQELFTELEKEA